MKILTLSSLFALVGAAFFVGCAEHEELSFENRTITIGLPNSALGDFSGTFAYAESGVASGAHTNTLCTLTARGNRYRLEFKGGSPSLDAAIAPLEDLIFEPVPGLKDGFFHSVERDGSVAGVRVSAKPLSIQVDVRAGKGMLAYSGRR